MTAQAPFIRRDREAVAFLQNLAAMRRQSGTARLARLAVTAARAYRLTLPAQSITGA